MNASAAAVPASALAQWWRWFRNPAFWLAVADGFAVLTALALPWSTTLVSVFALLWLGSSALIVDYPAYFRSLKQPICALPLTLFGLAVLGTLWSDAPWAVRLHSVAPYAKFLLLPGLLHHFERSSRGTWVFVAFLGSCVLMMVMSWITAFDPAFTLKSAGERVCGVIVKNYIDQGQEFSLCVVALAYPVMTLLKERKHWQAGALIAIALALLLNMVFVIAPRTAQATIPFMLALFAFRYLNWRQAIVLGIVTLVAGAVWAVTPRMCRTIETISRDVTLYQQRDVPTSAGLRLEYWRKSLRFIQDAPLLGHGTGSIRGLFEKAATGHTLTASGNVVANPHNQTLHTAIQWGIVGVILLYAMWLSHLLLFRGEGLAAWIGSLVVVQNVLSSLFNSHLVDFHAGWMYVLGVGVAGGMVLKGRAGSPAEAPVKA
jgi:O-antigen ligase